MLAAVNRDEELDSVLAQCAKSIKAHCQIFHPKRFRRPFSARHEQLFEVLDDRSVQKVLLIAHRGFGKTSIFNYAIPSQAIIHRQAKFIMPCSATSTLAVQQSENLKRTLSADRDIKGLIGEIKTDDFSKEEWTTPWNLKVMPRGTGQQIRGQNYDGYRPDLIIPDDLEKMEGASSEEQRQKLKEWFYTDLMESVDQAEYYRIIMVGTILHQSSLLSELRQDSDWTVLDFPLTDSAGKSYWTSYMSDAQASAKKESFRRAGLLHKYFMEYMNEATPAEDAVFKQEMFHYYKETDLHLNTDPDVDNIVILDPAKSSRQHAAFTAIVGLAVNMRKNCIYVRDIVNKHIAPDHIYDELFSMADRLNARVIGYESSGLSEFITQPLKNEVSRRGKDYELVELKARRPQAYTESGYETKEKGKEARVAQLASYYRMGQMLHNDSGVCDVLEAQLMAFPRSKYWDVMDATAYVIEMTHIGERYFEEQLDEGEDEALLDAEDAELEDLMEGDDKEYKALERYYDRLLADDEEEFSDYELEEI